MIVNNIAFLASQTCKSLLLMASGKLPKLEWLVYEVTDACNSRCKHCNIWRSKATRDLLSPDEIETFLRDPLFDNLRYVIITGGEPVLRRDLVEVIRSMHRARPGVSMTLSTNGLLPERVVETVGAALENGVCMDVGISLDGLGEFHDSMRGVNGNFAKVDRLVGELVSLRRGREDKLTVTIAHTLSPLTTGTVNETRIYAERFGLGFLTQLCEDFSYYRHVDGGDGSDNSPLVRSLESLPPSLHNEILLAALRIHRPYRFRCYSMRTFFLLRCNGDVAPCLRFSERRVGNVRETTLSHLWDSPAAWGARRLVKSCEGCSNTWATAWSCDRWPVSFLPVMRRYFLRKQRTRIENESSAGEVDDEHRW